MATKLNQPQQTEFFHRCPENYLLVENQDDGRVVILAALDNDTERRKAIFIHELGGRRRGLELLFVVFLVAVAILDWLIIRSNC